MSRPGTGSAAVTGGGAGIESVFSSGSVTTGSGSGSGSVGGGGTSISNSRTTSGAGGTSAAGATGVGGGNMNGIPGGPTNDDIEAIIQMATSSVGRPPGGLNPPRDTRTQLFVGNVSHFTSFFLFLV